MVEDDGSYAEWVRHELVLSEVARLKDLLEGLVGGKKKVAMTCRPRRASERPGMRSTALRMMLRLGLSLRTAHGLSPGSRGGGEGGEGEGEVVA